jgi:hypothetical protein
MSSIATLTLDLDELKDKRVKVEKEHEKATKSLGNAKIAVLAGVLLAGLDIAIGTYFICGIGGLLLLAGLFSWSTNGSKAKKAKEEIDGLDEAIAGKRREIAETTK